MYITFLKWIKALLVVYLFFSFVVVDDVSLRGQDKWVLLAPDFHPKGPALEHARHITKASSSRVHLERKGAPLPPLYMHIDVMTVSLFLKRIYFNKY